MASRDEIIRFVFKTTGQQELADMARTILELGGDSEEAGKQVSDLLGAFTSAKNAEAAVARFGELRTSIVALNGKVQEAKARAAELGEQLLATEAPTKKQQAAFDAVKASLERLAAAEAKQRDELTKVRGVIEAEGLSVKRLGDAQSILSQRTSAAADSLRKMAASAKDAAAADAARLQSIRDAATKEDQARRATDNLAAAREKLAKDSASAAGAEDRYASTLASSAAKIGAIGAAALGITGAIDLARNGLAQLIQTAGEFQKLDVQLDSLFGTGSQAALAQIQQFAKDTPFQLQQVADAFVKLKAFGLDPTNGTFQAIADEAATLGGSTETLTGIVLGLGQAWAKQKLQGEEILQLVERGVPVWELLAKATGKSTAELQALSQAGKLGRTEIAALITEIGKSSEGAAGALANTLPGQINKLQSEWTSFLNLIANSGALDALQAELQKLLAKVKELSDSGDLARYAKSVSDALVSIGSAVAGTIGFLVDHKEAIGALAVAYATFKAGSFLAQLDLVNKAGTAMVGNFSQLTGATKGLSTAMLALAAVDVGQRLIELHDVLEQTEFVLGQTAQAQRDYAAGADALVAKAAAQREALAGYADTVILAKSSVAELGAEERARYDGSLVAAARYYGAVLAQAKASGDAQAAAFATDRIQTYNAALDASREAAEALATAAANVDENLALKAADTAMAKLFELRDAGKGTAEALAGAFDTLNLKSKEAPEALTVVLRNVRVEGESTARAFDTQLVGALGKLEGASLARFQSNVVDALRDGKASADDLAKILDGTLQAALGKLGVSATQAGSKFTAAGADMIDTFKVVATNAQATGHQIEAAFEAALSNAKTEAEASALGEALKDALDAGLIGAQAVDDELAKLADRVRSLKAETDPLADSFAALGIKSQAALDAAAAAAKTALAAIAQGAREGAAAQSDVVRAFKAYSDAAKAAAADSGAESKQRIQDQLNLQATVLGVADALKATGDAGAEAGDKTSAAFDKAKGKIEETGRAIGEAGDAARDAGAGQRSYRTELEGTAAAMGGIIAIGPAQAAALQHLNELLRQDASLTNIGLKDAQYLLSTLGPLAGGAAQILESRISELQAAADRASDAADRMRDQAASMLDEIDQLEGNEKSIEDRRHLKKLQDLYAEAQADGALNSQGYRDLVALENKLHDLKMNNLQKQATEKKKADDEAAARSRAAEQPSTAEAPTTTAGSGPALGTIKFDIGNGQIVNVRGTSETAADLKTLMRVLDQQRKLQPGGFFGR